MRMKERQQLARKWHQWFNKIKFELFYIYNELFRKKLVLTE
jgi:hypothetical protein